MLECAKLAHGEGLVNAMVTNGMASERVIGELAPYINAWNIDLKAGTQEAYDVCGGKLDAVQRAIRTCAGAALAPGEPLAPKPGGGSWPRTAHVEVTTLVIPGYNDSDAQLEAIARFLASVDTGIVWHLTRFFPRFRYADRMPTPIATLEHAAEIGRRHLERVVLGNV